jgi:hypothetical protein
MGLKGMVVGLFRRARRWYLVNVNHPWVHHRYGKRECPFCGQWFDRFCVHTTSGPCWYEPSGRVRDEMCTCHAWANRLTEGGNR